jgi:hypothetical protein
MWRRENPVGRPPNDVKNKIINEMRSNPQRAYSTKEMAGEIRCPLRTTYSALRVLVVNNQIGWRKYGTRILWMLEKFEVK